VVPPPVPAAARGLPRGWWSWAAVAAQWLVAVAAVAAPLAGGVVDDGSRRFTACGQAECNPDSAPRREAAAAPRAGGAAACL